MINISRLAKGFLLVLLANPAVASPPKKGPVIVDYGPVFDVPATAYNLKSGIRYQVSMDVAATAADQTAVNRNLESAARFLNMQAQAGTPTADLELAVVVHGPAARDLLTDDAYFEQFWAAKSKLEIADWTADGGRGDIYLWSDSGVSGI